MSAGALAFYLSVGARNVGGVYALRARVGDRRAQAELYLPETLVARAQRLLQPGPALRVSDPERLGEHLGEALFPEPVRELLLQAAQTAAESQAPLPIYLHLRARELAALPWEWLLLRRSSDWRPALREDYPLLRVQGRTPPAKPLGVSGPLRVLAVASHSEEAQLGALERALAPAVRERLLTVEALTVGGVDQIGAALERKDFHVLHCAAPAAWGADGQPHLLDGAGALELQRLCGRARTLRLAVLPGAAGGAGQITPAVGLLAADLAQNGLPATITLGGALAPEQIAIFARACYQALAHGEPADAAVTAGRQALAERAGGWGMVQIYLRPGGERLFRLGRPVWRRLLPMAGLAAATVSFTAAVAQPWVNLDGRALGSRAPALPTARIAAMMVLPSSTPTATEPPTATPTPTPSPAPPPTPTALPPVARYAVYSAGERETLDQIAARFGSDAQALAQLNRLEPEGLRGGRALVVPVYRPDASEPGQGGLLVVRGNPNAPRVALTFDIEIDTRTLYDILAILRERGLHGTFFLTGRWAKAFPDAARAIVAEGHEVANHSLTHPFFSRIGLSGAASEIEQTEQIIQQTTGSSTRPFFRFPYGDWTPQTLALVGREGFVACHWSADEAAIPAWLERARANPAGAAGAILLMHGRASTVRALPGWLDRLSELGLQPGTLSETLR